MVRFIRHTLLLAFAASIVGCAANTRDAVSPGNSKTLACRDAKQQIHVTSPRDCIERGGMLL
jgi:hypothetical protein